MPSKKAMSKQVTERRVHRSHREIGRRIETEVHTMAEPNIEAPDFLTQSESEDFYRYADMLNACGLYSELDADTLGTYIKEKALSDLYASRLSEALLNGESDATITKLHGLHEKAAKHQLALAKELGLTPASRSKLNVAAPENEEDYEL